MDKGCFWCLLVLIWIVAAIVIGVFYGNYTTTI